MNHDGSKTPRVYETVATSLRATVNETFKAATRELRAQGATSIPFDDRAERLIDAITTFVLECEFK